MTITPNFGTEDPMACCVGLVAIHKPTGIPIARVPASAIRTFRNHRTRFREFSWAPLPQTISLDATSINSKYEGTIMHNVISFPPIAANCSTCRWSGFCFARDLNPAALAELSRYVIHSGPIKHGDALFRQGDKLQALYVVRAGSVKTYLDSDDGCEQIVGFQLPGDLVGFDAIAESRHPTSAVALETTAYCAIPYERVTALASKFPGLWSGVMRAAAAQVMAGENHVLVVGQKSAPARLAKFLLGLSDGFRTRGCSRTEFNLSMSRQDIANYLAVAVETISRLFTDLQRRKVIAVDRRFVQILSRPALQELACDSALLGARTA